MLFRSGAIYSSLNSHQTNSYIVIMHENLTRLQGKHAMHHFDKRTEARYSTSAINYIDEDELSPFPKRENASFVKYTLSIVRYTRKLIPQN